VVKAGESFLEMPGNPHKADNASNAKTRVIFSIILPKGAPLTTVVPEQSMPLPNTGEQGAPLLFPETGYSLEGDFRDFWSANGDLALFGMPIDSAR
jgi:hypothetical protein